MLTVGYMQPMWEGQSEKEERTLSLTRRKKEDSTNASETTGHTSIKIDPGDYH